MNGLKEKIREGDIHKVITVQDQTFEIRYGYYEDYEREKWDPIPIYPDFIKDPMYDKDGYPFVTSMQYACKYYVSKQKNGDSWCADCIYFPDEKQEIAVCRCSNNKLNEMNLRVKEKEYEKESV